MTDDVQAAFDEWTRAVADGDVAAADSLIADDYVLTSAGGVAPRVSRQEWLDALAVIETRSFAPETIETRVFGDVAVIASRVKWDARLGERDLSGEYALTDVLARADGRWQPVWRISARVGDA